MVTQRLSNKMVVVTLSLVLIFVIVCCQVAFYSRGLILQQLMSDIRVFVEDHGSLTSDEDFNRLDMNSQTCTMAERQNHIERACRIYNWEKHKVYSMVDDPHHLIYCPIPKAGSITFRTFLGNLVTNITDVHNGTLFTEETGFLRYNSLNKEEKAERSSYKRLMIVRHPFDKLRSAYDDKLSTPGELNAKALNPVNIEIVDRYFSSTGIERNTSFDPWTEILTFPQFLELVATQFDNGFQDAHWLPMTYKCDPCFYDYDLILRLETLSEDIELLYAHLVQYQADIGSLDHLNIHGIVTNSLKEKLDHIGERYKNIDKAVIDKLKKVYKRDLEILGYNWHPDVGATCSLSYLTNNICC